MMAIDDRKMFAPLWRGNALTPAAKLVAMLTVHEASVTAISLAIELARSGMAVGTRDHLVKRVGELLDDLEQAGSVERIPDGRYRVVRAKAGRPAGS